MLKCQQPRFCFVAWKASRLLQDSEVLENLIAPPKAVPCDAPNSRSEEFPPVGMTLFGSDVNSEFVGLEIWATSPSYQRSYYPGLGVFPTSDARSPWPLI